MHFGIGRLTNSLFVMGIYLEARKRVSQLHHAVLTAKCEGWCVIVTSVQVFNDSGIVYESNRKDYFLKENKIKTNIFEFTHIHT